MNFSMRNFIKNGFLNAVGKMGDYWIVLNAAGWFDKGVLLETDLVEIQAAIDARNAAPATDSTAPSGNAEPVPDNDAEPVPDNDEPAPDNAEPVPDNDAEPVPDSDEPAPETPA